VKEIVRRAALHARALDEVAQRCAEDLFASLRNTVLIRVYATCPFGQLPAFERERVGASTARTMPEGVSENTAVLTLMGTAGITPEWRDRRASKAHLGIPLVAPVLDESNPIVASLMAQLSPETYRGDADAVKDIVIKSMGRMGAVVHVSDAATSRDRRGRLIVPEQDFVRGHEVKSVFGTGGAYMDGTVCLFLMFTKVSVQPELAERFLPMVNYFKMATMFLVNGGRRFGQTDSAALRQTASR
jgi:hypothetical protein